MRKYLLLIFLILVGGWSAGAQSGAKGNLNAAGSTCGVSNACIQSVILQQGGATITLSGTFSATVQFEVSGNNGTSWVALNAFPSNSTTGVTSATGVGVWQANIAGYTNIRVRCSTYASGTVAAQITISTASASIRRKRNSGTVYYVSNSNPTGSDSNNGTSTASPWLTVGKVNSSTFNPGDTVELNCSNTWHEELIVPSSGTATSQINYTSYPGCTTNPEITAADVVGGGGWTQNSVTALDTQTFASGGLSGAYWSNTACTFPTSPVQGASTHSLQCSAGSAAGLNNNTVNYNTFEIDAYFQLQSSTATSGQKTRVFTVEGSAWNGANGVDVWVSFNGSNYQLSVGTGSAIGGTTFNITTGTWYLLRYLVKANGGTSTDSGTLFANGTQVSARTGLSLTSPVNSDAKVGGTGAFNDVFTENFDSLSTYNQDSTQLPNVWFTTLTTQPRSVIFNETQNYSTLAPQASASAVSSTNQWFWGSNVLYVYSVGNPASTYTSPGVQAANRTYTAIRNGQSYFTISNMILEGSNQTSPGSGGGVFVGQTGPGDTGESSGVNFNNVEVRYHGFEGIWLDSIGGTLSNSYAHDNLGMCYDFDTGANMVATNIHGAYCQYGSYPGSIFAGIQNLKLIGCEFDHNSQNGLSLSIGSGYTVSGCYTHDNTFNGIYFDGTIVTGATITGSKSTGNGDTGIYIAGGATETNIILSYNVVYSNTTRDIYVAGGAPSVRVYGNVLANSPTGLWITGANTAVDAENNASYNHSTAEVRLDASATGGTITINYNDWYHGAGGTFMNYHGTLCSFANWQSTASQDTNSQSTNPLFTNAGSNIYTLTGTSPLIGAAFNLGSVYSGALTSASTWPNGVAFATQMVPWNQGAYVYP